MYIYIRTENRGEISARNFHVLNPLIAFTFVHSLFFPHFFCTENGGETSAGEFDAIYLFFTRWRNWQKSGWFRKGMNTYTCMYICIHIFIYMYMCIYLDKSKSGWCRKGMSMFIFVAVTRLYVTWLIYMGHGLFVCDVTRWCVTWLVDVWHDRLMCDMTRLGVTWSMNMWHDLFLGDVTYF